MVMKDMIVVLLNWVTSLGYLGIALALMIEVIPSELVLAYGGFLVSHGTFHFWAVMLAGTFGGILAQLFLYWLGAYGGRPFLERYGRFILLSSHHLDLSERWFNKYGSGVIFFARFIPVIRHAISIPAGIAKMSVTRFLTFTALAIVPWSFLFILLGERLGKNWGQITQIVAPYMHLVILSILVGTVSVFIWKYMRRLRP